MEPKLTTGSSVRQGSPNPSIPFTSGKESVQTQRQDQEHEIEGNGNYQNDESIYKEKLE